LKQLNSKTQFIGKHRKISSRNIPKEVKAILSQYRKGLTQKEIANNLDLPHHIVAQKLLEMEDQGLISRKWINDEYSYTNSKQ
jgi:DNA-binding transcriptional regulator LsrR (DeoR family)